jgi:CPA2 family monovalent cation:H+ antiporter-2
MPHATPLLTTIVGGLVLAFVLGAIANRLRMSPLLGYLLAGVVVGPFTPGINADPALAQELAEIGVILLMFGVGLHISLKDLLSVKRIAIPGAIAQIAVATLLGMGLAWGLGWSMVAGFVFGLALSVASTVVLLRALEERGLIETERGRIAVGWLVVEDIAMVLALVLLPAMAEMLVGDGGGGSLSFGDIALTIGITVGKIGAFVVFMLVVGRRAIPWLLHVIAHSGSRELFSLAVLAIALGVAFGSAELFGASFALGAFFAGMVLKESELSQRAAEESLPLRDAFAVLFFVSVGMLFDPSILLRDPLPVLATFLTIVVGKSIAALVIVRAFGHPLSTALLISASLAQIGEFSFILAALGVGLGLLPEQARDLIVTGAILSILANPFCFFVLERAKKTWEKKLAPPAEIAPLRPMVTEANQSSVLRDHAVVVGFGRVGHLVAEGLADSGCAVLVIEERRELADLARKDGHEVISGNGAKSTLIRAANLHEARWLFIAIPNGFEAGQIAAQARQINLHLEIVARAHSDAEVDYLKKQGANLIIMGEREIARGMLNRALGDIGPDLAALADNR